MAEMDKLLLRLESVTLKIAAGAAVAEGDFAPSVQAYYDYFTAHVQPFINACNKVEGTKPIAKWTETAFKHCGLTLQAAQECAKPSNPDFVKYLDPIVQVYNASGNPDRRAATFPQEKSFAEAIQCLNWVMSDGPKPVIMGQLEAADFYLIKVLTAAKDKGDDEKAAMREFVSTLKTMMTELANYGYDFHKTGLVWKFKGADILTWKPGQAPAKKEGSGAATVEDRIGSLLAKLEGFAASLGGGEDAEGTPIKVADYTEFYSSSVQPFLDTCAKLDSCKQIGTWAETCFKHLGELIKAAHECKKPSNEALMAFLSPIVQVITACGNPDKRSDSFNQEKAFQELSQAMNWIMQPLPKPFIIGQLEASDFYLMKVLTGAKDKADPEKSNLREFVKLVKVMMTELAAYVQKHYKTGLEWKVKDGKALSALGVASAPSSSSAVVAEAVAKKLKKKPFVFKPVVAAAKKGSIDTSRQDKIFVDNFGSDQKEPVIIKIPPSDKPKTGVFIGSCKDAVIKVEGKAKNITVSGCTGCGIVFDECVTTVEIINSKKCQVQAITMAGTFTLDKCDRVKIYIPAASHAEGCLVYTSQSSATNVFFPTDDGEDMNEYGVPEQILSTFSSTDKPTTLVIIPDAE